MTRALVISLVLHALFLGAVYYSSEISLLLLKDELKNKPKAGVIQVDLLYKPTFTPMKKGQDPVKRLPPPKVQKTPPPQTTPPSKPTRPKKQPPSEKKRAEPQKNFQALFDKMRQETGLDRQKAPREDNFPKSEKGQEEGQGTGGLSDREISMAEQALQAAARKYAEIARSAELRKQYPNAEGFIQVRLIGVGDRLELVSLRVAESSGLSLLDQSCENAIRRALENETFAQDVVSELSGKEHLITCQF